MEDFPKLVGRIISIQFETLRVHFFSLVPPSAITPNNTGGGVHFDATPAVFDIDV
jgi:hypothetical protein